MVATHAVDAGLEQLQQAEALRHDSSRLAALNPAPDVGSKMSRYHLGTHVLSMGKSWENMHLVEGNARVLPHTWPDCTCLDRFGFQLDACFAHTRCAHYAEAYI